MELPHIGEACVVCNRNDYLPFRCAHCAKIVCIDHKFNHGSDCPLARSCFEANQESSTASIQQKCDYCRKITLQLELSQCSHCGGNHCLYHRHQVQHDCMKLAEDAKARRQEESAKAQRQQEALDRLKITQAIGATKEKPKQVSPTTKPLDPKKLALARRVNIMRIRQSARGPPNVLDGDKIYFEVEFVHNPSSKLSNETKHGKKLNIFATKTHTIGRLIDYSSHELDISNKNDIVGSDQLVFELKEKGLMLDNRQPFQQYIDSGVLDSGDKLTITYKPDETKRT